MLRAVSLGKISHRHGPFTCYSRRFLWTKGVQRTKFQIYKSSSRDPFLNLSIEQYLLDNSPPDSYILFIYVNKPCVVIGRNQNPWREVSLSFLSQPLKHRSREDFVKLLRRRSGGGTVFHDEGNVNWSVICPLSEFTRDKHVEMIVRAMRTNGISRSRVNERHDIVLDQGEPIKGRFSADDTHWTPYVADNQPIPFRKVSGSAYKLTRTRALHHGTALLQSPNLDYISSILNSPAKPFLISKGVESVSSPTGNLGIEASSFIKAVEEQFVAMYYRNSASLAAEEIGHEAMQEPSILESFRELKSPSWIFGQTPRFDLCISDNHDDRSAGNCYSVNLHIRNGRIASNKFKLLKNTQTQDDNLLELDWLNKLSLADDWSWHDLFKEKDDTRGIDSLEKTSRWLDYILPTARVLG